MVLASHTEGILIMAQDLRASGCTWPTGIHHYVRGRCTVCGANEARTIDLTGTVEHDVTLVPTRYNDVDHWETPGDTVVRMPSRYQRPRGGFIDTSLHYIGPGGLSRRVFGGPELPGPYAFVVPHASVISAHREQGPAVVITLTPGDRVVLRGETFELRDDSRHSDPKLVHIVADVPVPLADRLAEQYGEDHPVTRGARRDLDSPAPVYDLDVSVQCESGTVYTWPANPDTVLSSLAYHADFIGEPVRDIRIVPRERA